MQKPPKRKKELFGGSILAPSGYSSLAFLQKVAVTLMGLPSYRKDHRQIKNILLFLGSQGENNVWK